MYRLIRFGTTDLQHYNQVDAIGSGVTPTAYQGLPEGGALDLFGSQQKHPGAVERSKSMRLTSSTEAALESLFFQLLALRGQRDRLYRETSSGDIQWQYARLVEVTAERSYETAKFKRLQDISLRFITQEAFWRGALGGVWYFDSGEYFDSGLDFDSGSEFPLTTNPTAFNITLDAEVGRAPIRAVRIEITPDAVSMNDIIIARTGGESVQFSGTVLANKTLVIDTGTMQVTNDGVEAYNDFVLSPTADQAVWFALEPGDNPINVAFSGGGTGWIRFTYYEAWY